MPAIPSSYVDSLIESAPLKIGSNQIYPQSIKVGSYSVKGIYQGSSLILHPEAVYWLKRVYANGGGMSAQTFFYVNQFCWTIDGAGLRDRFSRLNLFVGTSFYDFSSSIQRYALNAAVVPLYIGFYYDAPMHHGDIGNAVDTNINFIESDFGSLGLDASNGSKGLLTGLNTYTSTGGVSPYYDSHLSVYITNANDSYGGDTVFPIGSMTSPIYDTSSGYYIGLNDFGQFIQSAAFDDIGSYVYSTSTANNEGVILASTNGMQRSIYRNGIDNSDTNDYNGTNGTLNDIGIFGRYDASTNSLSPDFAGTLGAYSIGKYMTDIQVSTFSSILLNFQSQIGREV